MASNPGPRDSPSTESAPGGINVILIKRTNDPSRAIAACTADPQVFQRLWCRSAPFPVVWKKI